jgi:hypothetical protein
MKEKFDAAVVDTGLLDNITSRREWKVEEENKTRTTSQSRQTVLPEDIVAQLEQHLGDGNAKVTVGAELAHSRDFGCKAQAFVSISVTCNNCEEDIMAVHSLIHPLARKLVNEDLEAMKVDRDAHLGAVEGSGLVKKAPVVPRAAIVAKQPGPQAQGFYKPPKGPTTPEFRR